LNPKRSSFLGIFIVSLMRIVTGQSLLLLGHEAGTLLGKDFVVVALREVEAVLDEVLGDSSWAVEHSVGTKKLGGLEETGYGV
jgi:hypothetical protein